MTVHTVLELREYFGKSNPEPIADFDAFLDDVDRLFKLRSEAEQFFQDNRHMAKSARGALPLPWRKIAAVLRPECDAPKETVVTRAARDCLAECEEIAANLRKMLVRRREAVGVGMVQQLDGHCLRWLSRQPGRTAAEKAGARQRVLAVVRREDYNTLENRVFKDFLTRVRPLCEIFLREHQSKFINHDIVKKVRRLWALCGYSLRDPAMDGIAHLRHLPMPNYALRQDRRYAKVWRSYCEVVRLTLIYERLWSKRGELRATLETLQSECGVHADPRAKFHCPLWFNHIDGKREFLDQPYFENEMLPHDCIDLDPDQRKEHALDLTGVFPMVNDRPCPDLLIYGKRANAEPYLQNYRQPSKEDLDGENHYFLGDIFQLRDRARLRDYFKQLYALIGGTRWIILVPDDWDAEWQEAVIQCVPLSRDKVFLLWRSVAAIIGIEGDLNNPRDGDTVAVIDAKADGSVDISELTLTSVEGELVPRRKSYARNKGKHYRGVQDSLTISSLPDERFLFGKREIRKYDKNELRSRGIPKEIMAAMRNNKHVIFVGGICSSLKQCELDLTIQFPNSYFPDNHHAVFLKGIDIFSKKRAMDKIPYFDELEALSLIVQNPDEQIEPMTLVEPNAKHPGGVECPLIRIKNRPTIRKMETGIDFLLAMGDITQDTRLKKLRHDFHLRTEHDQDLNLEVRMTPGQGMAIVKVFADGLLKQPVILNFQDMETSDMTICKMEKQMERSFPPDSPSVKADATLWENVRTDVLCYMKNEKPPDGSWFAKGMAYYGQGNSLPPNSGPLEGLRRKNVFGNDLVFRKPSGNFAFEYLFKKLAEDYHDPSKEKWRDDIARLIAWTYQADNDIFSEIKKELLAKYRKMATESGTSLLRQEYTLIANFSSKPTEWQICWDSACARIGKENTNVNNDLRLLYNLLMFNPMLLGRINYTNYSCWDLMLILMNRFEHYRDNSNQILMGNTLKAILFLLRRRRYDGKKFLMESVEPDHYKRVSKCLSKPLFNGNNNLRKLLRLILRYLDGKGVIDGLPTD